MPLSLHIGVDSARGAARRVDFVVPLIERAPESPTTVPEAIAGHHRVSRFRAGNSKDEAYPNRGRTMREFGFVQINPQAWINFLVVDVDRPDAELRLLHPGVPEPHWIIRNEENGHAQAGWMIDPVYRGSDARPHPVRYAQSVQRSLDRLVGNDESFTRFLVRNPVAYSPVGTVAYGSRLAPYSLGELMRHMQEYRDAFDETFTAWQPEQSFGEIRSTRQLTETEGRNNALFHATRTELWRRYSETGMLPGYEASTAYAEALNLQLPQPLDAREVRELAASAVRQVAKGNGQRTGTSKDAWLRRMGKRGGSARTAPKKEAAVVNARKATAVRVGAAEAAAEAARKLRSFGWSLQQIAREVGKSIRTVQRYLAALTKDDDISQPTGSHALPAASRPPACERSPSPEAVPTDAPVTAVSSWRISAGAAGTRRGLRSASATRPGSWSCSPTEGSLPAGVADALQGTEAVLFNLSVRPKKL